MRTIRSRLTPLRQRMLDDLQLRHYSPDTMRCYLRCVADFAQHFGGSPAHLGPEQVRTSPLCLVEEKHVAWPSVVQAVCALRFFYRVTLGRPGMLEDIAHPRRPFTLPTMLRQAAVAALLTAAHNLQHRAILTTLSAAGLRVSELCQVQVTDIDSARMVLRVRQGTGPHDRYVMLSPKLLPWLRHYWPQETPRPWLLPGHPRPRPITTRAV
jgi:integrase/recombinase XerD